MFMSIIVMFIRIPVFKHIFFLVSFIFWIRCSEKLASNKRFREILLKLSFSTFFIYAAHEMTLSSFKKICAKILPRTSVSALLQYLFIPVVIVIICIVADRLVQKITPKIHKVITGSR